VNLIDLGHGPPIVLIPGIQGRWEWMRPTVEALAAHCRVLTFSLADEPTAAANIEVPGFDAYVAQVRQALDQAGVDRAVICGVSYGGLVAAAFAAAHPDRVAALVLASALPPPRALNDRAPVLSAGAATVSRPCSASPACGSIPRSPRPRQDAGQQWRGIGSARARSRIPFHPTRMARRARLCAT
jgi:pimeloyl-ACP methyl ester carboxylesterase